MDINGFKQEGIKVDEACLKEWWVKPYYLLEIKDSNITNLSFTFEHPCFIQGDVPCRQFIGLPPP